MCGIIGAVSNRDVAKILLKSLRHLEYRGYDSAGIAIIDEKHHLERIRTAGKVKDLAKLLANKNLKGSTGIAHTRWATHGKPSEINAHPHIAGNEIAIVHNGIIENHLELRRELIEKGCKILSDTDSELIAHYVYCKISEGLDFLEAVRSLSHALKGAYAIGLIRRTEPSRMFALRKDSPLVLGLAENEIFICSDSLALHSLANRIIYLDEGDMADINGSKITIYNTGRRTRTTQHSPSHKTMTEIDKGNYALHAERNI